METRRTVVVLVSLCLLLVLTLLSPLAGCAQPTAPAPKGAALPKVITATTNEIGTAKYLQSAGMRAAVEQFSPMTMRLEPYDSEMGRVGPLRSGETQFAYITGLVAYWVTRGIDTFKDWGPTPLRRVWNGAPFIGGMYSRGDAGFKTLADLRGKRIPQTPAAAAWSLNNEICLAFGGLTLKDVKVVTVASIATGLKGPLEGTLDATQGTPWSSQSQELAASRHGIKWFEMPPEDKAGWDRVHAITPWNNPMKTTGAGLKKGETIWLSGYENGLYAYPTIPDDVVYAVNKALKDGYDVMKKMHPDLGDWTWERAVSLEGLLGTPYHNGTVKFMKDMGAWTPAHEAYQQAQLKTEAELAKKVK